MATSKTVKTVATKENSQVSKFIDANLNTSISTVVINEKTEWHLVANPDQNGIVRRYQVARGDSKACLELTLSPAKGFEFQVLTRLVKNETVIPKEVSNPRQLKQALEHFLSVDFAKQAVLKGEVNYRYVASTLIIKQLGFEAMNDRDRLAGFKDATENQLKKAENEFLELFPQFKIASQQTVTVPAKTITEQKKTDKEIEKEAIEVINSLATKTPLTDEESKALMNAKEILELLEVEKAEKAKKAKAEKAKAEKAEKLAA